MCNDHELIVGYVYGELSGVERRAFEAHLAGCAACREELTGLRATRVHLAAWAPPEPDLDFSIVRGGSAPAAPPRRSWFAPAWGLAAAAVLVLAVAAAIANVEVRYDATGFTVRAGWAGDGATPGDVRRAEGQAAADAPDRSAARIAALDARVRELEAALARQPAGGVSAAAGTTMSDAEMMRRVREIVGQSENRQQRELALQLAQVVANLDRALQVNYMRINRGLGQHREETQAEVARQLNYYLTRVSNQR